MTTIIVVFAVIVLTFVVIIAGGSMLGKVPNNTIPTVDESLDKIFVEGKFDTVVLENQVKVIFTIQNKSDYSFKEVINVTYKDIAGNLLSTDILTFNDEVLLPQKTETVLSYAKVGEEKQIPQVYDIKISGNFIENK